MPERDTGCDPVQVLGLVHHSPFDDACAALFGDQSSAIRASRIHDDNVIHPSQGSEAVGEVLFIP
jgi:hypothetical protein